MRGLRGSLARHPLRTYVVLAYTLSWACWLPLVVTGSLVRQGDGRPTDLPGLMGPAVAALLTLWITGGGPAVSAWSRRLVRWRAPWWCWAFVAGIGALGYVAAVVRWGTWRPDGLSAYTGAPDLGLALTFLLVLVVNGMGEEAGWRGFLADRLLVGHGLIRTAGIVGIVWAGWHLPLFLVVDSFRGMGIGILGWLVGLFAGSLVLTWLYAASGRSVLVVAVWHAVYNFTSGTAAMSGLPQAVTSTVVIVMAVLIARRESRPSAAEVSSRTTPATRTRRRVPLG